MEETRKLDEFGVYSYQYAITSGYAYYNIEGEYKKYDFDMTDNSIGLGMSISNTLFCGNILVNNNPQHSILKIKHCHFQKALIFTRYTTFINAVIITNSVIFSKTLFLKCTFPKNLTFENNTFHKKVFFRKSKFYGRINFNNCKFLGGVDFEDCKFYPQTVKGTHQISVKSKVTFQNCVFGDGTNFVNATFDGLADFWNAKFLAPISFYKADFLGVTVFSAAKFKGNAMFTYTTFKDHLILRHAEFDKGIDLALSNIHGEVNLFKTKIDFKKYESVDSEEAPEKYDDIVVKELKIPIDNKRETFRILKNLSIQQNNRIDSLEFYRDELASYKTELKTKNSLKITFKNTINRCKNIKYRICQFICGKDGNCKKKDLEKTFFQEKIINYFNSLSNNHGQSYFKAFWFTVIFGAIIFGSSLLFIPCEGIEKMKLLKQLTIFLNPTHSFDYMEDYSPCQPFYIIDFLGRAIVGYGYYQFIAAFRKYTKK
nr:pentapeptide repeat-containing protein [uncultured Carboxylicivirga sp.]